MAADVPPLRYLAANDVAATMPPLEERLRLAELTMTALVADAELPPKIGVHPGPEGAFGHAMPALLRHPDPRMGGLGMKWVTGFPSNNARGLPAVHALVVLNDPATGVPIAIIDGGPITAQRTAAVSGVAIARFAPRVAGRSPRAGIIGAGVQARSHLPVLGHLLPGLELALFDRHPERGAALATEARAVAGIAGARATASAREAVRDADVVVTAASLAAPGARQFLTNDWLGPDSLVVSIDYSTCTAAGVARDAALFLVDERGQFEANRAAGHFEDYPDPAATLGEAIVAGTPRPARGRVLVSHLGVGLADVVFGRAILRAAEERGLGVLLG